MTTTSDQSPLAHPGDTLRAKWLLDGASTLAEAADRLTDEANRLQALHDAGWTLAETIEDDYGTLVDPTGDSGPEGDPEDDPSLDDGRP